MDSIGKALRHAVTAGRQRAKAREQPDAARGLLKAAELNSAVAATYLDDAVDQPAPWGREPAGPCKPGGCPACWGERG